MKVSVPRGESRLGQRATAFRKLGGVIAVVLAVTLTVTLINSVYSTPASVQGRPYDGEILYRALFFASGPIATKIPTLQKAKSDLPPEYKNLEGQIIKYVQGKEPNFFVGFARSSKAVIGSK